MNKNENLTYKKYLQQVCSNMLAHATTPLLKIIEIAIIGRFLNPIYMAGLAVAVTFINTWEWLLGFLRASMIEESGSAFQKGDKKLQAEVLAEHITIAITIALVMIIGKEFLWGVIMLFYKVVPEVEVQAKLFINIGISAIPMVFVNYMIMSWFLGRGKLKNTVVLEIGSNLLNITLCLVFTKRIQIQLIDIARFYFLTQAIILVVGVSMILKEDREIIQYLKRWSIWWPRRMRDRIRNHRDILGRTVCIVVVTNIVMMTSSYFGTIILSANYIMIQLKDMMAYIFEGISTTIRGMAAQSKFGKSEIDLRDVHRMTLTTIMYVSIGLVISYELMDKYLINRLIKLEEVKTVIAAYDGWLVWYSMVAGWGLGAYGLYAGLVQIQLIAKSTLIGLIMFLFTYIVAMPTLGNHGLWLAFIMFYLVRSFMVLGYEGHLYE